MYPRCIELFGTAAAGDKARIMLENLPEIRRIDDLRESGSTVLILHAPISEKELIPLLACSGISGFSYLDQASSRKASPLSL